MMDLQSISVRERSDTKKKFKFENNTEQLIRVVK